MLIIFIYDISTLDSVHRRAYDNVTDLLQQFMDRQWDLHKMLKQNNINKDSQIRTQNERKYNKEVIKYLQLIRYILQGHEERDLINKCPWWGWTRLSSHFIRSITVSNWAQFVLGIGEGYVRNIKDEYINVFEDDFANHIINLISPTQSHSIFDALDLDSDSMTLSYEISRIKRLLNVEQN